MPRSARFRPFLATAASGALVLAAVAAAGPASASSAVPASLPSSAHGLGDLIYQQKPLRVATYNLSLNRGAAGQLVTDLSTPDNEQAKTVAEVIQRAAPDIVLLNEFDYVEGGVAVDLFRQNYLQVPQNGAPAATTHMPSSHRRTRASQAAPT